MKKQAFLFFAMLLVLLFLATLSTPVAANAPAQNGDLEQGKYIANIAGCVFCHTPYKVEYNDLTKLTIEQIKTLAFDEPGALDRERLFAGGRAFDLGPGGVVFTRNLTPDKETGLGDWTDELVIMAMRTGVRKDGTLLFPVMPYHVYNGMADSDVKAVIAYLRSVKAVKNEIPPRTVSTEGMSPLPAQSGIIAPDPSDKAARGAYLVNHVTGCADCHTPIDPQTGAPQMDKYLAGRQPYEGPWGIVYGGNITPDEETGIGSWTEEEIKRALITGVRKDGRRLILMPWYAYAALTPEDADAIVYYLKNDLPAVSNQIPAPSLKPEFNVLAENAPSASSTAWPLSPAMLWLVAGVIVALVSIFFYYLRKKASP